MRSANSPMQPRPRLVDPVKRTWATGLMQRLELPADLPARIVEPGFDRGHTLARYRAGISLAGTPGHCSGLPRYGLRRGGYLGSRWYGFPQLRNVVTAGHGTGLPSDHSRCIAAELHQRRRRQRNHATAEECDGTLDAAMLPAIVDRAGDSYDYRELMELAASEASFRHLVDPDDESFLRPTDMPAAINQFCSRTHQPSPASSWGRTCGPSLKVWHSSTGWFCGIWSR